MRIFVLLLCSLCVPALFAGDDEAGLIAPAPLPVGIVKSVTIHGSDAAVKLATKTGTQLDQAKLRKDVQSLWATGLFRDISVKTSQEPDGAVVVFEVAEKSTMFLRDIRIEPHSFGMQPTLATGTPIDSLAAQKVATQVQKKLVEKGYIDAVVEPELKPVGKAKADLMLHVTASNPVQVHSVEVVGDTVFTEKEVTKALQALRVRKVLPGIPGIWHGFIMRPAYSEEAVQSDLARLTSFYLSKGYFDAKVSVDDSKVEKDDARLRLYVSAGPQYKINQLQISVPGSDTSVETPKDGLFKPQQLCDCLMKARREAELKGIVDFNARLSFHAAEKSVNGGNLLADLNATVEEGIPYTVGRIELQGARHFKEGTIRKNFLLDEGDLLDTTKLRKSIARLNQTQMFDPIEETQVAINTDESTGTATVIFPLRERKKGMWNFSGPVGPISFAGPLQFMIASRLPPWGRGIVELSTWYLSFSLIGYAHPIAAFLPMAFNKQGILPVFSMFRPYTAGEGWKSGLLIAPQLGWQATVYSYATTQLTSRLLPVIQGNTRYVAQLPITFERPGGDGVLLCQPPKPRFHVARMGASVLLQFIAAAPGAL